jgi:hypothetical protein
MYRSEVAQIHDNKNIDMTNVTYRIEDAMSQNQSVVMDEVT